MINNKNLRKAGFEDLRIWREAHRLMLVCHKIANNLPHSELERKDQLKRSSSSSCDNIAEGYTSYYYNDKLKGMYVARKEAGETQNHLKSLASKGFISEDLCAQLVSDYQGLIIGINKFCRYIIGKRDSQKVPKSPKYPKFSQSP